jgi:ubiquinone/menaquinone biosynthesis C-methylase UbiE
VNEEEQKLTLAKTFDTISAGYDCDALRFFRLTADEIPGYLALEGDEHVLDVAVGTGNAAIALSGSLPRGQVTGVDFSSGMLSKAKERITVAGMQNIKLLRMDMQSLDFPDDHFDAAVSAFGIFFVQDMTGLLRHIVDKVKNNGKVVITSFHESTFAPLNRLLFERLDKYGVAVPPESLKRLTTPEDCTALFQDAGLVDISVDIKKLGYYLNGADQWWDIVWNAGFRRFVTQLPPENIDRFRNEHLREIGELSTENGIWLEVNVMFTSGNKA